MEPQLFMRRPFFVQVVQVTEKNMRDVARWANGQIRTTNQTPKLKYVYIHVRVPLTKKQTQAFVGDWVLRSQSDDGVVSFKIYSDKAFHKAFVEASQAQKSFTDYSFEQGEDLFSPPVGQDAEKVNCD